MTYHRPGEQVGDFKAMRHKRRGAWLWRCVHCSAEKTASFWTMRNTGMQRCACQGSYTLFTHQPGECIGDFTALRRVGDGQWLWRCVHCRSEKTTTFSMMRRTGMQHCRCQKPTLTPAQQRVADLFGKGMSNKEIAGLLGINQRTVSDHLRNIYEKRLQGNA